MSSDVRRPLLSRSESCHHLGAHLDHPSDHHHGFGAKSISSWGSAALIYNGATGTAMVVLPLLYQQAGWVTPTMGLLTMYILSSFAASMLCEAIQRIPGNKGFSRRWEYCNVVNHYFGSAAYMAAQVGFNLTLQAANISAMIVTAQVMDGFVRDQVGASYAIHYGAWPLSFVRSASLDSGSACAWGELPGGGCDANVISLGFVLCMAICIPFGWLNLEDNMGFQWLSCIGTIVFTFEFMYEFAKRLIPGAPLYCPGNGPSRTPPFLLQQHQVLGICVFAYSYVCTVPSWLNEKRPGVNVNRSLWLPVAGALVTSLVVGFLGAWSYQLVDVGGHALSGAEDILKVLDAKAAPATSCHWVAPQPLLQYSIVGWSFLGFVPQIPVQGINVRYNLQSGGICGPETAFFWGVVAPWIGTAFLYQREVLSVLANWTSILVGTFINFIVPPLLYRAACRRYPTLDDEDDEEAPAEDAPWKLPSVRTGPLETVVSGVVLGESAPELTNVADPEEVPPRRDQRARRRDASWGEESIEKVCGICKRSVSFVIRASHLDEPAVDAVPKWLRVKPRHLVTGMVVLLAILTSSGAVSSLVYRVQN